MTYAIANVICGVLITDELAMWLNAVADKDIVEAPNYVPFPPPPLYPNTDKDYKLMEEIEEYSAKEFGAPGRTPRLKDYGFVSLYLSTGDSAGYCGVVLGKFNEGPNIVHADKKLANLTTPTTEEEEEAKKCVKRLHPKFRELASDFGVHLVWSSS